MIYLSICIPTYLRIEATRDTIASIYDDIDGVSLDEFEVIVSDNDVNQSSKVFENEFHYPNFHYHYTKCEGFLNSYYVLGYGNGQLLKLHNNTGRFAPGALRKMIVFAKSNIEDKPAIFYSNDYYHYDAITIYHDVDEYLNALGYLASWSAGFCIWKEDYDLYKDVDNINKMFPQTSLFLSFLHKKQKFVIDDSITRLKRKQGTKMEKKGGYNQFEVFGVQFNDLIFNYYQEGKVRKETFEKIKTNLLRNFLSSCYIKTVILKRDAFDTSNIAGYLSKYYGRFCLLKLWYNVVLTAIKKV